MRRLAAAFRGAGRPIVHVVRLYRPDGSNVDLCRRRAVADGARLVLAGSPGAELAPGLVPPNAPGLDTQLLLAGAIQHAGPGEVVVYKPRWGAFFQTPLEAHLRALGVSTLVFAGCNFPNCPRTSIYEASERDFRLVLVEDAVSGLYERCNEHLVLTRPDVIREMHEGYLAAGADIIETDTFGGTRIVLGEYGLQDKVREINATAARLAREACARCETPDRPRFVAGSMGPGTKTISVTGGVTF